jgi:hypothetical protein
VALVFKLKRKRSIFTFIQHFQKTPMNSIFSLPELMYLSPTTREKAVVIAQELVRSSNISPREAISRAVLIAKNWAVKNVNRNVWKKLKSFEKELI